MTENIDIWYQAITNSLSTLLGKFAEFIPGLLAAIVIASIGYFIAKILRVTVKVILNKAGIDKLSTATGISEHLQRFNKNLVLSSFIASLIFWVVFMIFLISAAESLGMPQLRSTLDQFILYIPKIIAATLILLFGLAAANLAKSVVFNAAKSSGFDFAKPVANAIYGVLVILVLSLVIGELEIETRLLDTLVSITIGAVAIACAISLGLGSKNASESVLFSVYVADTVEPGQKVTLKDGSTGLVKNIGAVATSITLENGDVKVIDNKSFLDQLLIHS